MKKLYTVFLTFADFTFAVEQYQANSVEDAVKIFFQEAECLQDYNRKELLSVIEKRLKDKSALIHVADGLRGVWLINVGPDFPKKLKGEQEAIYGGRVIQTDPHAPRRA